MRASGSSRWARPTALRARRGRRSARRRSPARPARSAAIAVDPSDPSGNTVYVAGASGGIWKTTDFLTTNPDGPTYIPLTDFGPTSGINIGSIAVFARNNNPNQSIIIAATGSSTGGEGDSTAPGVGFLISMDGGATWNLYDSTDNVDASGNMLPIDSAARDRAFVGIDRQSGCRRSPADADRPGDHLRRAERHQRRHLAERKHGPDLAVDAWPATRRPWSSTPIAARS